MHIQLAIPVQRLQKKHALLTSYCSPSVLLLTAAFAATLAARDLRGRFIVCAGQGSGYSVGDVGGYASRTPTASAVTIGNHTLTIAQIKHAHSLTDRQLSSAAMHNLGTGSVAVATSATVQTGVAGGGGAHNHPGSFAGNSFDNRPPFIVLKWIQKL